MAGDKSHKKKKKKTTKKTEKKRKVAKERLAGKDDTGKSEAQCQEDARQRNPKAFVFSSRGKAKVQKARSAEKEQRRMHVPVVEREVEEPPPFVVLLQGPPGVGKTTLIKNLIKHYTRQNVGEIKGPITLISGKSRRLTFIECPQDLHGMVDASKYADLVLLMVDGAFGFEMETFEFLNLLQVQGFPKVMGVLTHLDSFKDPKKLKKTKKALKHRFWAEIYQGAKLFYLNGMRNGKYMKREVLNLARFISVMRFRPLNWRMNHPYLLADRFEDATPVERVQADPKMDREITVFGYLRGTNMKLNSHVHIAGVGDYTLQEVDAMPDPCPLPSMVKKRGLNEKERLVYAPMSDVGGLLYDKDAVYIDVPDWKVSFDSSRPSQTPGESMVLELQKGGHEIDQKLADGRIQLFKDSQPANVVSSPTGDSASSSESDDTEGFDSLDEDVTSSEDEEPSGNPAKSTVDGQSLINPARVRRRALFSGNADSALEAAESPGSEETDDDLDEEREDGQAANGVLEEEDEVEEDSEGLGAAVRWKGKMLQNAQLLFSNRVADLQSIIYGQPAFQNGNAESDLDDDGEDLFRPVDTAGAERSAADIDSLDAPDVSCPPEDTAQLEQWQSVEAKESVRNRFVTGDWEEGKARDAAGPDNDSDSDAFGDFEDMETGQQFSADGDAATATAMKAIQDEARARRDDKAAKKAAFDTEYDVAGSSAGIKDRPKKGKKEQPDGEEDDEETYYDAMKKEMSTRAMKTKSALESLNAHQRIAMEGFRPGTYLRLRFTGIPCELVQHFNPKQPLLVGGLSGVEQSRGCMQLRLKRHRWFPKILKTRDPLTFSIGWRRFQSVPVYAIEDQNGRHRMLKYTPEHMHCVAHIYGALAPTSTGVVAIQSAAANQRGWRISATGVVTTLEAAPKVVKKLKLSGTPSKILKNTAFIGGMFNSPLEVAKFEGAAIRTVSGIKGTIKRASNPGRQEGKAGTFRATFEDKPLMSDIVFLRAWVAVEMPRFYNPVTNLLAAQLPALKMEADVVEGQPEDGGAVKGVSVLPDKQPSESKGDSAGWVGMKTVAQLRRDQGLGAPRNPDSLYRKIERAPRKFNPLKIPRALQAELPYKSKPKQMKARKRQTLDQKRAVVLEPAERKAVTLVQQLNALRNAKEVKRREQQARKHQVLAKKIADEEAWRKQYNKEEKKKRFVAAGLAEKQKNKRQRMN